MSNVSTFKVLFVAHKGKLKRNGRAPILARITINGQMTHLTTQVDVEPEHWLGKEGRSLGITKQDKLINSTLQDYRTLIQSRYNEMFHRGEVITAAKLKNAITSKDERSMNLLELCDKFNADYSLMVGKSTTHKTYSRYLLTRKHLAEFMASKNHVGDIPLADLNPKFIKDFETYLLTHGDHSNNYVVKFIQRFRTIFNLAKDNGWVTSDPFATYKFHFEKVDRGFLTAQELEHLGSKQLPSDRLTFIRDTFVFSCYCGLAYIDLCNLTKDCLIKGDDGNMWIVTKRQKTSVPVRIRLLDIPLAIINRYKPLANGDKLFAIPSNQKVNDYLKEIGAMCGINKKMTFHLARHTFATTITLSNGVPIETVSKMLGHTNIRTTQIYARITDTKIGRDMEALSQKLNQAQMRVAAQ